MAIKLNKKELALQSEIMRELDVADKYLRKAVLATRASMSAVDRVSALKAKCNHKKCLRNVDTYGNNVDVCSVCGKTL